MKILNCAIIALLFCFSATQLKAQETSSTELLSMGEIEFTVYPDFAKSKIMVQFLLPKDQTMEMYLIDESGDKIDELFRKQFVQSGVKTYNFDYPVTKENENYFIVIKANDRSVIKKIKN
ncbi:hypothetical protein [Portibacter lacus]|uniref:Secretion system C-terminal sorting domain-containing protein n=1 Tax=Portibacter lacus TaxID=1099794 RepID=A0AA37SMW5_9BACT|nr:hypothetical protein [Portibacter lacus]GLR15618.1 hypothetical protein GCM10007940_02330 [Portibacter lacus]